MRYHGPRTRHLAEATGDEWSVEGRTHYLEDRSIQLKQTATIEQKHSGDPLMPNYLYEQVEEAQVRGQNGEVVPFTQVPTFGRLSMAKTFIDCMFKPENAANFTHQEIAIEQRLAPLLCADRTFKNVTREPTITVQRTGPAVAPDEFAVQTAVHGRFWFGYMHLQADGTFQPYDQDSIAFGVVPKYMSEQAGLGIPAATTLPGRAAANGRVCGEITFRRSGDTWACEPIQIHVPVRELFDEHKAVDDDHADVFCETPELRLTKVGRDFYLDSFVHPVDIPGNHFHAPANHVHTSRRFENLFAIPVGTVQENPAVAPAAGQAVHAAVQRQLYWFVPRFRYREGNTHASVARPRRITSGIVGGATITPNLRDAPYLTYNKVDPIDGMEVPAGAGAAQIKLHNRERQAPYWGDFFSRHDIGENQWSFLPFAQIIRHDANDWLVLDEMHDASVDSEGFRSFKARARALRYSIIHHCVSTRIDANDTYLDKDYGRMVFILAQNIGGNLAIDPLNARFMRVDLNRLNSWSGIAGLLGQHVARPATGAELQDQFLNGVVGLPFGPEMPQHGVQIDIQGYETSKYGPFSMNTDDGDIAMPTNATQTVDTEAARGVVRMRRRKLIENRGVFNLLNTAPGVADAGKFALAHNTLTNAEKLAGDWYLVMPYREDTATSNQEIMSLDLTASEPFFGYASATTELGCDYPLDTARYGKKWPSVVQDYSYTTKRDFSKLLPTSVFQHDPHCALTITPEPARYTTLREADVFNQAEKDVSKMAESSHDIQIYSKVFSAGELPEIEFQTRQGQFEYVFMFCEFIKRTTDSVMPSTSPVVSSLRYYVRGRENRFVNTLDRYDIENTSRRNCHELSDWRAMHEAGRGVLLHLADFGLTEDVAYGPRERMEIKFQLTSTVDPEAQTVGDLSTQDVISNAQRRFTIALIRQNRLLEGDIRELRFSYLNEKR